MFYPFKKLQPSTIPLAQSHSSLSNEVGQDSSTTATHLCILLQFLLTKNDISILDKHVGSHWWLYKSLSLLIRYLSTIMSCFRNLYYYWQSSRSSCIWKYVVDGLNYRDKRIIKLSMAKLLNPEWIQDYPIFSSTCRFMKMKNTKL